MARVLPLTDTQIKKLRKKDKRYKVADGNGLYLAVEVSGSKRWEYHYKNEQGKRTSKKLGVYPEMNLNEARKKRDHLKYGTPPTETTFADLKKEYFDYNRDNWSTQYMKDTESLLSRDFSSLLETPLSDLDKKDLIQGFKNMRDRGLTEAIRKAGSLLNRIFIYGITMSKLNHNPMQDINPGFFIAKKKVRHHAHITDEPTLKALLCAIKTFRGIDLYTRTAMEFAVHVFVRPGNIRMMEKGEVDFTKKLWTIPAEKMKMGEEHEVPLTPETIEILKRVWDLNTSKYVFPSPYSNSKPLSENTLNNSLKRLGVCEITAHGLRHTASTFLNEKGFDKDIVEKQLAHVDKNAIRRTYNKALYMDKRREMLNWWSSYLSSLQENCESTQ